VLASSGDGRLPVPPGPVWRSWGCWPQAAGMATQLRDLLSLHLPGHAANCRSPRHPGRCLHQRHRSPSAWGYHRWRRMPWWWLATVPGSQHPLPAHHAMVCNARTKGSTMRHDLLHGAWRRIAHRAWVAIAVKPAMERPWAGTRRASLERGDMLAVLPDKGLAGTDVSVVHPAAISSLQQAAHTAGAAASAWKAAKSCK
jgi:hypothetical protein